MKTRALACAATLAAALLAACDNPTEVERVGAITITAPDTLFDIGASVQLTAAVLSATGALMTGQTVAWSSAHPEIASISTSGRLSAESLGRTYIRATSGDASDSVVVVVRAGACRAAVAFGTIAAGDNRAGTLTRHDCLFGVDGRYRAYGYQLDLGTHATLSFELESSDFMPGILITNRNMHLIDSNWPHGYVATLVLDLPAGQYIVWAAAPSRWTGAERWAGAYQLRVRTAQLCGASSATAIALGQAVSDSITDTDCSSMDGWGGYVRADGYQLDLGTHSTLYFDMESSDFQPQILITNHNMQWIDGTRSHGHVATLLRDLPAGQYIVWAAAPLHGTGAYQLRVGTAQFCGASSATAIALGQTVSGSISDTDCFFHHRRADGHRLSLAQATGVEFQLTSSQFTGLVVVTTLDFDLVDWTEATGDSARVVAPLPAGEYLVWASSQPAAFGAYQLSTKRVRVWACQPAGTLTLGQSVAGELTHSDCIRRSRYNDDWFLTLAEPTSVRIDLTSSQFDTFLEVRDANLSLVGVDDDGGEGTNSRLILALPAGEYAVRATSWGDYETGSYELLAQLHTGGVPDATSSATPAGRALRLEKKR
jgi:hypothetical protein